ncbi:hypothetical protein BGW41_004855 [Actinomortierella wolfii]|nr:hypothetical protein BGW41_004855 [Actinomortierella wolfii]
MMASQWDHDSRSFSDDYNLHGASQRSMDHPSVTRDDIAPGDVWGPSEDDNDDDDMVFGDRADLIAHIVEGRPLRRNRQPSRLSGGGASRIGHRLQNEAAGQYYMDNGHEPHEQWQGTVPHQDDLHSEGEDHHQDEYGGEQQPHIPSNNRSLPVSRMQRRHSRASSGHSTVTREHYASAKPSNPEPGVVSEKQESKQQPRPALKSGKAKPKQDRRIQLPLEDEEEDNHHPQPATSASVAPNTVVVSPPTSGSADNATGRRHPEAIAPNVNPSTHGNPPISAAKKATPTVAPAKQSSIPVPGRFTRITPKPSQGTQESPAKKPVATIPAPPSGNEVAQESVKELRQLLNRLGLKPTAPLDAALSSFDAAQMERGGMCDLIGLIKQVGKMYDERQDMIDEVTNKILAIHNVKDDEDDDDREGDRHSENERIKILQAEEISALKKQLQEMQETNQKLEEELRQSESLRQRLEDGLRDATNQLDIASEKFETVLHERRDLEDQLEAAKGDVLQQKQRQQHPIMARESSALTANLLQDHLAAIDQMLQQRMEDGFQRLMEASKATQAKEHASQQRHHRENPHQTSAVIHRLESIEQKIGNLQSSVDGTKDALLRKADHASTSSGTVNTAPEIHITALHDLEMNNLMREQEALLNDIMQCLGVQSSDQLRPALQDIEHILRELTKFRKFIARAEKIIWEVEIAAGEVLVRSELQATGAVTTTTTTTGAAATQTSPGSPVKPYRTAWDQHEGGATKKDHKQNGDSNGSLKGRRRTQIMMEEPADSAFLPGRTCTKSLDATLQRLQQWREVLDLLNCPLFPSLSKAKEEAVNEI